MKREERIARLAHTMADDGCYFETDLRHYYNTFTDAELEKRCEGVELLPLVKPVKLKQHEIMTRKRDEYCLMKEHIEKQQRHVSKGVDAPKLVTTTPMQQFMADILIRPWCAQVQEICDQYVGIKLQATANVPDCQRKVKKIAAKYGYTGEVMYG